MSLTAQTLIDAGASAKRAARLLEALDTIPEGTSPADAWSCLAASQLGPDVPFSVHRIVFDSLFSAWDAERDGPPPAWIPTSEQVGSTNIARFCKSAGHEGYDALYRASIDDRAGFWERVIDTLGIRFKKPPSKILGKDEDPEAPAWLEGARLNIADSCFQAPGDRRAIVFQREGGSLEALTYDELDRRSNRFANGLAASGLAAGDAIAIAMPMTVESVVAYLGIVKAGAVVVSIADSFSADEIATRLRIAKARAVVTQDIIVRGVKKLPMYQRVVDAGAERAIVIAASGDKLEVKLRDGDVRWQDFLSDDAEFKSVARDPDEAVNILFSSGTTGEPKAIPWTHTTPIKCGIDGYFHQDIQPEDVVAWPTNIGWMMGPWLVFASLLNNATMALYYGPPNTRGFCEFVARAGVRMLGIVPSLVRAWREGDMTDGLDWSRIKLFSSTGEASNADDYLYLMSRAGYRPVVEYCGGTEIGGGYITGTLVQPASPATFSTPTLGLSFYLLDENGKPGDTGELFLVPPSIGLSQRLLNRDHHEVYYEGTPKGPGGELLRRHGDQLERLPGGYYRALGRADDTMNLGGIKVSSAEIERVLDTVDGVTRTAAIAVNPAGGGPSRLVIYAVAPGKARDALEPVLQEAIKRKLNPLFRISDVQIVDALPVTASNKVMRRELRAGYRADGSGDAAV
jgi:acetyl-CoA synthetase